MIYAQPSSTYEAVVQGFDTGLAGTVGVRLIDNQGATTVARTTTGITESIAGSGIYTATLTAPATAGQYTIVWDDGSVAPAHVATEDLTVTYEPPASPAPAGGDLTTRDAVKARMGTGDSHRDDEIDVAISDASALIMAYCGREFAPATDDATRRVALRIADYVYPVREGVTIRFKDLLGYPADIRVADSIVLNAGTDSEQTLVADEDYLLVPQATSTGVYGGIELSPYLSFWNTAGWGEYAYLDVTGDWGFATVPTVVASACIDTVRAWLERDWLLKAATSDEMAQSTTIMPGRGLYLPWSAIRKLEDSGFVRGRSTVGSIQLN